MQGKTAPSNTKPSGLGSKVRVRTLPFSDSDVEEGRAEWKNIPEAVRTAILALSRAAAESEKEIEQLRSEYNPEALKQRLKQEIDQKANTEEVKQTLNSIAEAVEDRIHRSELEGVLGNYVREDDVVQALQDTLSKRDAVKLIEKKADHEELKLQLAQIHQRLDKLSGDLTALGAKTVTVTDLSLVRDKLERKVDAEVFQAALQTKAGVEEVQEVLDKKVDLEDLENLLAYKVDGKDFEDLAKIVEAKADQDGLDQLWEALANKVEDKDLELVRVSLNRKADNRTVESHSDTLERLQRDMQDIVKNLEGVFEENRVVIDKVRSESSNLMKELVKKPNKQDIAELRTLISKKVDGSLFIEELGKAKEEFAKDHRSQKLEFERFKRAQDESRLAAGQDQESERKQLRELVQQVVDQQNEMTTLKDQEYEKLLRHIQDLHETSKEDSKLKQQEVILELRGLKKLYDTLEKKKLNVEEARSFFSQFEMTLKTKANVDEVQSSLNGLQSEFSSQNALISDEFFNKLKSIEISFSERLSKKAQAVQVEKQLATKIDVDGLEQTIENLLKSLKLDGLDSRVSLVEQKLDLGQSQSTDSQLKVVQVEVQGIKKALAMKANLDDVLRVLDQKCGK